MPFLMLVCIQAIVLMMIYHASPSEVGSQFIGATSTTGGNGGGSDTTIFGTFLFHTTGNSVLVAFGNCDLLCRL